MVTAHLQAHPCARAVALACRLDMSKARPRLALGVVRSRPRRCRGVPLGAVEGSAVTDAALLFQLSRGDERAYRELFRRHERAVYRVALAVLRSPWDAEDVVSAAFLELWRKREKVRLVDESVLPWLLTVVTYQAKNRIRTTARYRRLLAKVPREGVEPDHADEVSRVIDAISLTEEVQKALSGLRPDDASVLLLCVVQELSVREAAIALGIAEGTVKSRLFRVKAKLRTRLGPHRARAEGLEA